jgi:thiol-disulfide isomerase/thioredoxin
MRIIALAAALLGAGVVPAVAASPATNLAPVLAAHDWINGRATAAATDGKVVIVDIFTFDCINCKHVTPELQKLHATVPASQLAIVGVHAPETPYERERPNVVAELARQGVVWPVAVDNTFAIWNAYGTTAWPTQLIFDKHGTLRKTVIGEGYDRDVESTVKALIAER